MSKMRKQIRQIYEIYKKKHYLQAEDLHRQLCEERDAMIDTIRDEYNELIFPLSDLCTYLEKEQKDAELSFLISFAPLMMREADDFADQMDTKRVYDADEVDALFDGFTNPMCPTAEDQHKAYARLMLSTLKK